MVDILYGIACPAQGRGLWEKQKNLKLLTYPCAG